MGMRQLKQNEQSEDRQRRKGKSKSNVIQMHPSTDESQRPKLPTILAKPPSPLGSTDSKNYHKLRAAHVRWRVLEEVLIIISRSPEDAYAHISRLAREAVDEIGKQVEELYYDL